MKIFGILSLFALAGSSQAVLFLSNDPSYFPNLTTISPNPSSLSQTVRILNSSNVGVGSTDGSVLTQSNLSGSTGDWFGNFLPGTKVAAIYPNNPTSYGIIGFQSIKAFSFEIQAQDFGNFWVETRVQYEGSGGNPGTYSPWLRASGTSNGNADGSALDLGVVSTDKFFSTVQIRVRPLNEATWGAPFAIGNIRYSNINPVPEPATVAALSFGAVAMLRRRRKS